MEEDRSHCYPKSVLHLAHSEFPPTKGSPAWLGSVLPVRQPIHEDSTAIGQGCFHDRVASKPTGSVPKNSPSEPKRSRFVPTFPVLKMLLGTCHSGKNCRIYGVGPYNSVDVVFITGLVTLEVELSFGAHLPRPLKPKCFCPAKFFILKYIPCAPACVAINLLQVKLALEAARANMAECRIVCKMLFLSPKIFPTLHICTECWWCWWNFCHPCECSCNKYM